MNETIRLAIETQFNTDISGTLPIEFENVAFDREGRSEWVRLTFLDGDAFNATMGNSKKIKAPGTLIATVFQLRNAGTKRAREVADIIADNFRNLRITSGTVKIEFGVPTLANGDRGDPVYWMENVALPFLAEDTKTDAT